MEIFLLSITDLITDVYHNEEQLETIIETLICEFIVQEPFLDILKKLLTENISNSRSSEIIFNSQVTENISNSRSSETIFNSQVTENISNSRSSETIFNSQVTENISNSRSSEIIFNSQVTENILDSRLSENISNSRSSENIVSNHLKKNIFDSHLSEKNSNSDFNEKEKCVFNSLISRTMRICARLWFHFTSQNIRQKKKWQEFNKLHFCN